jgi:acetyltransferase-like isoleucine patch superfamily enzyme
MNDETQAAPFSSTAQTLSDQAEQVRRGWLILPKPTPPTGWLVYSEAFVLRVLQGKYGRPGDVIVTPGWRAAAGVVRGLMAVAQTLLMGLSLIPVLSWGMEGMAYGFKRGSVGFFLRACYWKARLRRLGQDTLIDRGVDIWGPGRVEIGSCVHLDTYARLIAGEAGQGQHGRIVIGDYTHIGPRTNIAGRGGVTIGDCVSVQGLVHIYSATTTALHPQHPGQLVSLSHMPPPDMQNIAEGPVTIGDYASVGFASLILPKTTIGLGAIVHPYSQVSGHFEPFANVVGPGRARQNGWRRAPRRDPRLDG